MYKIYLDNAANTPIHPRVIESMTKALNSDFRNPSSLHSWGRKSRFVIEESRRTIAQLLNVKPSEIIFTSSGTESNNMILIASVRFLGIKRIITSKLEHKSILETVYFLKKKEGIKLEFVSLKKKGDINIDDLAKKLKFSSITTLVSLMHANNEIGNILPLKETCLLCKKHGAYIHSDMAQTLGNFHLNLNTLGIDFATASAHKFYGPLGSGFVFIRKPIAFGAILTGGGQERGIRSGTESIYNIIGLTKALKLNLLSLEKEREHIEYLKRYAIYTLKKNIKNIFFNGLSEYQDKSLYSILNISLPERDDMISFYMDLKGIAISQGSACTSLKKSHVLHALYTTDKFKKLTNLRISFGKFNKKEDIDIFVKTLQEYINK